MYKMLVEKLRLNCAARELWLPLVPQYAEQINLFKEAADAIEELSKENESLGKDLTSAVEMLKKKRKPKWIPCSERLPECDLGAEVGNIEWISCGRVYAGCFGHGGKYRDAYFRTWTDAGEGMDAKDADYWRQIQIPEPPKEET